MADRRPSPPGSWYSNITPAVLERACRRPGAASQFGGQPVIDNRSQAAQDEADRARYAGRYSQAYREYRRAQGYDDEEDK
jgi:hypothetical protein